MNREEYTAMDGLALTAWPPEEPDAWCRVNGIQMNAVGCCRFEQTANHDDRNNV